MVSYGLLTTIRVDDEFGPGDLVPVKDDAAVDVTVLGPEWVKATRVALYANGVEVRAADIPDAPKARTEAVLWRGRWTLPRPKHDVHLVAIATGPGVAAPYWPTAKPYQPTSSRWQPYLIGSTGAVWLDADASGRFDCGRLRVAPRRSGRRPPGRAGREAGGFRRGGRCPGGGGVAGPLAP
jgi:uncharacterized membrane protein YgcG